MLTQFILNGLSTGGIYALVAVALGVAYRTFGFFDFAHAAFFAVSAYVAFISAAWFHCLLPVEIGIAIGVGALCAVAYHKAILIPLQHRQAAKPVMLLASLGVFIVLEALLMVIFGAEAKSFSRLTTTEGIQLLGGRLTVVQIASSITCIAVVSLWGCVMAFSRIGLIWQSLASSRELAEVVGVQAEKASRLAFMAAGCTVGLAGILQAHDTGLTPSMGFGVLLVALVAVVAGGNSIIANVIAAVSLAVLQQIASLLLPTHWQDAVVFFVLAVFLLLRPTGVFGRTGDRMSA